MSETAPAATLPAPSTRPARSTEVDRRPGRPALDAVRRATVALTGALAALGSLATLWAARLQVTGEGVYVSQLGADGMPTATVVNAALLALAAGGALVGWALRGHRARGPVLGAWSTGTTLVAAGVAFAVASQVTCTAGCPVPLTPGSTAQDLGHTTAAVVGFGAAAWAMLQVGWSGSARPLRLVSRGAAGVVAGAAAAGGLLSVAGLGTDVGAGLEHLATTVAVLWSAVLAVGTASGAPAPAHGVDERGRDGRRDDDRGAEER